MRNASDDDELQKKPLQEELQEKPLQEEPLEP